MENLSVFNFNQVQFNFVETLQKENAELKEQRDMLCKENQFLKECLAKSRDQVLRRNMQIKDKDVFIEKVLNLVCQNTHAQCNTSCPLYALQNEEERANDICQACHDGKEMARQIRIKLNK